MEIVIKNVVLILFYRDVCILRKLVWIGLRCFIGFSKNDDNKLWIESLLK